MFVVVSVSTTLLDMPIVADLLIFFQGAFSDFDKLL